MRVIASRAIGFEIRSKPYPVSVSQRTTFRSGTSLSFKVAVLLLKHQFRARFI